jgi:hypothetical protein
LALLGGSASLLAASFIVVLSIESAKLRVALLLLVGAVFLQFVFVVLFPRWVQAAFKYLVVAQSDADAAHEEVDLTVGEVGTSLSRWSAWTKQHQAPFLVGSGIVAAAATVAIAVFTVIGVTSD